MNEDKKFSYTYSTPTEEEKRRAAKIQKEYAPKQNQEKSQGDFAKLKELDKKVKVPAKAVAIIMGIIGFLCLGLGMSMVLEWEILIWGSLLGVVGITLMAVSYYTHNKILAARKKKYADEILKLTKSILKEDGISINIVDSVRDIKEEDLKGKNTDSEYDYGKD